MRLFRRSTKSERTKSHCCSNACCVGQFRTGGVARIVFYLFNVFPSTVVRFLCKSNQDQTFALDPIVQAKLTATMRLNDSLESCLMRSQMATMSACTCSIAL